MYTSRILGHNIRQSNHCNIGPAWVRKFSVSKLFLLSSFSDRRCRSCSLCALVIPPIFFSHSPFGWGTWRTRQPPCPTREEGGRAHSHPPSRPLPRSIRATTYSPVTLWNAFIIIFWQKRSVTRVTLYISDDKFASVVNCPGKTQ